MIITDFFCPARSCGLAETPPTITKDSEGYAINARLHFVSNTSIHEFTKEAATSAALNPGLSFKYLATADFNPEKENSNPSDSIGRGNGIEGVPEVANLSMASQESLILTIYQLYRKLHQRNHHGWKPTV